MHKQWAAQEQRLVATVWAGDSQQFSPENQHCHHGGSLCFTMSCTTSEVDEQQIYHFVFCLERKAQAATQSISLQPGKQCKAQLLRCPQRSGLFCKAQKRQGNRELQLSQGKASWVTSGF